MSTTTERIHDLAARISTGWNDNLTPFEIAEKYMAAHPDDTGYIDRIAELLWPSDSPESEWEPDTFDAVADIIQEARPDHPTREYVIPERVIRAVGVLVCDTLDTDKMEDTEEKRLILEYERAMAEFLCESLGVPMNKKNAVLASLKRQYANL